MTSGELKGENGVFWEQTEKLGYTKGAWKCPNFVNHLPNPQYFKIRCYLPAEGTLTLMTSAEQGENGVFWEQMEILGSTKEAWNCPKCLKHLRNPQSCKISLYLRSGGTLTPMTSEETGENGVFWEQMEKLEPTKGAWNCPKCLQNLSMPQYFKSRCYLPSEGTLTLMTSEEKGENGVSWEQMEELGPTKGAWNHQNCLNHLPNPQYCKIRCYLPDEGTLNFMASGGKGANGVFWEQIKKLGPIKGA
jgi:hypothetical protein